MWTNEITLPITKGAPNPTPSLHPGRVARAVA